MTIDLDKRIEVVEKFQNLEDCDPEVTEGLTEEFATKTHALEKTCRLLLTLPEYRHRRAETELLCERAQTWSQAARFYREELHRNLTEIKD